MPPKVVGELRVPLQEGTQRLAVDLEDLQGFSVDDAADVLGCPAGTVKSRCFRGRARLAELLADYAPRPRVPGDDAPGNRPSARDVEAEQARPGRDS